MTATAGFWINAGFVDICELLVQRPAVLLPASARSVGADTWSLRSEAQRRRRAPAWVVQPYSLVIDRPDAAHCDVSFAPTARDVCSPRAGHARLLIRASVDQPEDGTEMTVVVDAPRRAVLGLLPLLRRRAVSDMAHRNMRSLAARVRDNLAQQVSDRDFDAILERWTRELRRSSNR